METDRLSRALTSRVAPRLVALALGAACILMGLNAALLRLNLPAPVNGAELAALHGPLMLVGFLGTVIALERAVAARTPWAFLAPWEVPRAAWPSWPVPPTSSAGDS